MLIIVLVRGHKEPTQRLTCSVTVSLQGGMTHVEDTVQGLTVDRERSLVINLERGLDST